MFLGGMLCIDASDKWQHLASLPSSAEASFCATLTVRSISVQPGIAALVHLDRVCGGRAPEKDRLLRTSFLTGCLESLQGQFNFI